MIYFSKQWHTGDDRDTNPGEPVELDDWEKPLYRPGWVVSYRTPTGKTHVGKIRYVFREGPGRLDFYRVVRLKDDSEEITFACSIIGRIEQ